MEMEDGSMVQEKFRLRKHYHSLDLFLFGCHPSDI